MLAPDSMLQQIKPTTEMSDYHVILPSGLYTSGTYTIPGGYTWDDFVLLIPDGAWSTGRGAALIYPSEVFSSAGWSFSLRGRRGYSGGSRRSAATYVSATQFSVTVSSTGRLYGMYGVLK